MANITLKEEDEKVTNLVIKPMHSNGVYKVHVRKEVVERNFSTWMPFIGQGRKSQKKLDTIENYINNHSNLLKDMWLHNKYSEMAQMFQTIL